MSAPTIITAAQLAEVFEQAGISSFLGSIADKSYCCFALDFIQKEFSAGLAKFQFDLGIKDYKPEENDCDDFAADASFYARLLHRRDKDRPRGAGLACGKFYFRRDDGVNHAIDWFVVNTPDGLRLIKYEPQQCAVLGLSEAETTSCFFFSAP